MNLEIFVYLLTVAWNKYDLKYEKKFYGLLLRLLFIFLRTVVLTYHEYDMLIKV